MQHLCQNWEKLKNEKCAHHSHFGTPSHTNAQCRLNKHIAQEASPNGSGAKKSAKHKFNKKKEDADNSSESDTDEAIQKEADAQQRKGGAKFLKIQDVVNHTFLATPSNRKIKQSF